MSSSYEASQECALTWQHTLYDHSEIAINYLADRCKWEKKNLHRDGGCLL